MPKAIEQFRNLQHKLLEGEMEQDEPVFLLRARDPLAAATIAYWCERARQHGVNDAKLIEAREIAGSFEAWDDKKLPD